MRLRVIIELTQRVIGVGTTPAAFHEHHRNRRHPRLHRPGGQLSRKRSQQALRHRRQFKGRFHRALKRAALAGLLVPDPVRVDLLALPRMLRFPRSLLTSTLMFT